jgi:hypothetical protein
MRIFYAKVGQKPDLMIYRNWLNLIELVASFKKIMPYLSIILKDKKSFLN